MMVAVMIACPSFHPFVTAPSGLLLLLYSQCSCLTMRSKVMFLVPGSAVYVFVCFSKFGLWLVGSAVMLSVYGLNSLYWFVCSMMSLMLVFPFSFVVPSLLAVLMSAPATGFSSWSCVCVFIVCLYVFAVAVSVTFVVSSTSVLVLTFSCPGMFLSPVLVVCFLVVFSQLNVAVWFVMVVVFVSPGLVLYHAVVPSLMSLSGLLLFALMVRVCWYRCVSFSSCSSFVPSWYVMVVVVSLMLLLVNVIVAWYVLSGSLYSFVVSVLSSSVALPSSSVVCSSPMPLIVTPVMGSSYWLVVLSGMVASYVFAVAVSVASAVAPTSLLVSTSSCPGMFLSPMVVLVVVFVSFHVYVKAPFVVVVHAVSPGLVMMYALVPSLMILSWLLLCAVALMVCWYVVCCRLMSFLVPPGVRVMLTLTSLSYPVAVVTRLSSVMVVAVLVVWFVS